MSSLLRWIGIAALSCAAPIVFAARAPHRAPVQQDANSEEQSAADAEAIEALPASLQHERKLREAPENLTEHLDAADAYVVESPQSAGKLEAADEHVSIVLESQPRNVRALLLAGRIAILRGQPAQAQSSYLAAATVDPNNAEAFLGLGDAYSRLKNETKAAAAFAEYRRLSGRKPLETNNSAAAKDKDRR